VIVASLALSGGLLVGCSSDHSDGNSVAVGADSIVVPLATSIQTASGPWATAAMGNLSQPLNTFWQLFHQPDSGGQWVNDVEVTATATNGGLVMASQGRTVLVGVLPSQNLKYSPLTLSSDGGRTFSTVGLLPKGLIAVPNSLAISPDGQVLALVSGAGGEQVLEGTAALAGWHGLASPATLGPIQGGGSGCQVTSLEASAFAGSNPVIGAGCRDPGAVGIFSDGAGVWTRVGPTLPAGMRGDTVRVLSLRATNDSMAALLGVAGPSGLGVVVAWGTSDNGRTSWRFSDETPLATGTSLQSVGSAGATGFFVVSDDQKGSQAAFVATSVVPTWQRLETLPSGTDTLVFANDGSSAQALSGDQTVLGVWQLTEQVRWIQTQSLPVQISFGSSN
jgi:hypothetical protein